MAAALARRFLYEDPRVIAEYCCPRSRSPVDPVRCPMLLLLLLPLLLNAPPNSGDMKSDPPKRNALLAVEMESGVASDDVRAAGENGFPAEKASTSLKKCEPMTDVGESVSDEDDDEESPPVEVDADPTANDKDNDFAIPADLLLQIGRAHV